MVWWPQSFEVLVIVQRIFYFGKSIKKEKCGFQVFIPATRKHMNRAGPEIVLAMVPDKT